MPDWVYQSAVSGLVAGLIAWGGLRVELAVMRTQLQWLRRDVDFLLTAKDKS